MFPMSFDRQILEGLPYPDDETIGRIRSLLKRIVEGRILPYFKRHRGTDSRTAARLLSDLRIERLEDERRTISLVSLLIQRKRARIIAVHECFFDYLAFVLPSDSQGVFTEGSNEERKALAFCEFLLRHQIQHWLYPDTPETDILRDDVTFAMEKADKDPTFYRLLSQILSDEMVGLRGGDYLVLFDASRKGAPLEPHLFRMVQRASNWMADLDDDLFSEALLPLALDCRVRSLGECWNRSRLTSLSLLERYRYVKRLLRGFDALVRHDTEAAAQVFTAFRDRWGLMGLFHELEIPPENVENKEPEALFSLFVTHLKSFLKPTEENAVSRSRKPAPALRQAIPAPKSLKDRIEEAKRDPSYPPQVIELIEKNKSHAVGHSGAKYSELIETLLAIPWKKIRPITITPQEFEEGLNRTHYGLERPKELICDFFSNLIRRYRHFDPHQSESWTRTGSAFLFVGPPGVGKTSLAISMAQNLGIPYHKISLGGMRDESDLRGHGFTYEGSKPGAIVQGLIKMGCMNGMFILDEADKTEKFAIATLLEILDPEQNHLFHDKYTQTTVDIDLSNCHFVLTANTLETVPPPVINRCEVIVLDRYSVEEKVAIARRHLIRRLRERYDIGEDEIAFDPTEEKEVLRHLVREYTYEPGVRELERLLRTLFFRIQRKELSDGKTRPVLITRRKIKQYLDAPIRPWKINAEDRIGEMLALGVNLERGVGSIIPIQATRIHLGNRISETQSVGGYLSLVHATGNIQKVMDESRKVAMTGILSCAESLGLDENALNDPIHLHFMGGSTQKDGPSAGGAIALALASAITRRPLRRDVAMTGEIDTQGRITAVGGIAIKLEAAADAGCTTFILPKQNLKGEDSIERLPTALKKELQILPYESWAEDHEPFDYETHILQVVAVDHIRQAAHVAFIDPQELENVRNAFLNEGVRLREFLQSSPTEASGKTSAVVLLVKTMEEIPFRWIRHLEERFQTRFHLLAWQLARESVKQRLRAEGCRAQVWTLNPQEERLSHALRRIMKTEKTARKGQCVDVVAPFYFIQRDGILEDMARSEADLPPLRLLANNYSRQGAKIKRCKSVLNGLWATLACVPPKTAESLTFRATKDGIHVVDLSFIPEKYRLDVQRAQQLLAEALRRCMAEVFSGKGSEDFPSLIDTTPGTLLK